MTSVRIGTVDLPDRMERARYFKELSLLELSAFYAGPMKPSAVAKWATGCPEGALALVAPWVLTHRKPPKATTMWPHDGTVGDFRDSVPGRAALAQFKLAVEQLHAGYAVFRSPSLFAASAANRDTLKKFFGEVATEDAVGTTRVWVPDGLWDLRTAIAFANELGVLCAFDPLVRDPGQPPEVHYDLDVSALYLRVAGLGRSGPIRSERLDDLVMLLEHYAELPTAAIAFESPSRWNDARNLKKTLENAVE
jgi:uncharacterized protein YecE (DUF72 family)